MLVRFSSLDEITRAGNAELEQVAVIGRMVAEHRRIVTVRTGMGGTRVVDVPAGDLLPMIC